MSELLNFLHYLTNPRLKTDVIFAVRRAHEIHVVSLGRLPAAEEVVGSRWKEETRGGVLNRETHRGRREWF